MKFADIWNTSLKDYYILFYKRILTDSSYFLSNSLGLGERLAHPERQNEEENK